MTEIHVDSHDLDSDEHGEVPDIEGDSNEQNVP